MSSYRVLSRFLDKRLLIKLYSPTLSSCFPRFYSHVPEVTGWDSKQYFNMDMRLEIERLWKKHVDNLIVREKEGRPSIYILSMFPYPSGNLHMGHVRVYTISDTLARFYRMLGYNVLHPMGWDSFGLPAENAAIQSGEDPSVWTEKNIRVMKSQLNQLGFSFDWDRELSTSSPEYYKWTQYIFLQMFRAGLIYRKPSLVNWDPVDKTVLADEQIDENGNSWRSGAKAEKILLTQWFVRSTKFSRSLMKELANFRKDDWADVINMQKSWIGDVNGVIFDWAVEEKTSSLNGISIPIWTAKPEHVLKVNFIAVKPESMLDIMQTSKSMKEYEFTTDEGDMAKFSVACLDFHACNPFTQEKVPIYVVDGLLPFPTKSDTYMGVSSESAVDALFAKTVGLECADKVENSSEPETAANLCLKAQEMGFGGFPGSSNLKDWLISRQRYWGTPIPIIHCAVCGTVPVPESQLPVQLPPFPQQQKGTNTIGSPLSQVKEWVNTTCPKCGGSATRETDTMDTFVDSSWYYLRFLDPHNNTNLTSFEKTKQFMPVGVYIGGKEHATLHLYYARIVSHFLHQIGITACAEPFQRLLVQGMVMGQTYIDEETGRYLRKSEVELHGKDVLCRATGKKVAVKWEKMSKSKYNGVEPSEAVQLYGIDTTRLLMLADVAPFSHRNWDPEGSKGVLNWQYNMHNLVSHFLSIREDAKNGKLKPSTDSQKLLEGEEELYDLRNKHLSIITFNYKNSHLFMAAIKSMQTLTKKLRLFPPEVTAFSRNFELALGMLITTLAPMAPHFASELWRGFVLAPGRLHSDYPDIQWNKSVLEQSWPELDLEFKLPFHVFINHKDVLVFHIPHGKLKVMSRDDLEEIVLQQEKVKKLIGDKTFSIYEVYVTPERGGGLKMKVSGLQLNDDDEILSNTKSAKQQASKKKKKENASTKKDKGSHEMSEEFQLRKRKD